MKIDEKTGLPAIPEEYKWIVEEGSVAGTPITEVVLAQKYTVQENEVVEKTRKGFWGNTVIYTETVSRDVEKFGRVSGERLCEFLYEEDVDEGSSTEGFTYVPTYGGYGIPYSFWLKVLPTNAENIRKAAERAWTNYLNVLHGEAIREDERRHREKYLGTYPPKTLEGKA